VEPSATFDAPANQLIAVWQADRGLAGADGLVVARADASGLSWTTSVVPGLSRCSGGLAAAVSDPWVAAGPDGTVYLSALELRRAKPGAIIGTTLVAMRSLDGGKSWSNPVTVAPDRGKNADKPTVTADPLRPRTAYLTWTEDKHLRREAMISRTQDGGLTWSTPKAIASPGHGRGDLFPQVAVQTDGSVTIVYAEPAPVGDLFHLGFSDYARVSHDGGLSFSAPVRLNRLQSLIAPITYPPPEVVRANPAVFALASGLGGAYVVDAVIHAQRHGSGRHLHLSAASEIVVCHERSDGTWSPATTIASVPGMAFLPTVATAGPQRVAVTWYQMPGPRPTDTPFGRRPNPAATETTIESAVSNDGGTSWSQQPLGPSFNLMNAARGLELFVGDYQALVGANAGFEAIDVRTPTRTGHDGSDVYAQSIGG
jgi:hypothetical protein